MKIFIFTYFFLAFALFAVDDDLKKAIEEENLLLIEEMIKKYPELINKNTNLGKKRPLYVAARIGNIDIIKLLIEAGANINYCDSLGDSPLHEAIHYGHIEIVKFFIKKGANINIRSWNSMTPLNYAIDKQRVNIVKLLLDYGADINIKLGCCNGKCFLSKPGSNKIIETLLVNGYKLNKRTEIFRREISQIVNWHDRIVLQAQEKNIDLPYVGRIKNIHNLIIKTMQNKLPFNCYFTIFPQEIWSIIFSYIPKSHLILLQVSKCFYNAITSAQAIKYSLILIPLDKKINYLIKQKIDFPKAITWENFEEFAQKHSLNFEPQSS